MSQRQHNVAMSESQTSRSHVIFIPDEYVPGSHVMFIPDEADVPEQTGFEKRCIYRVPPKIRQTNHAAYTPSAFAIGPLHKPDASNCNKIIVENEKLKKQYANAFLKRSGLGFDLILEKIRRNETSIREFYDEDIRCCSNQFVELIIVDSLFIIECFLRFKELPGRWAVEDPIFSRTWRETHLWMDLILIENQMPFAVIQGIYNDAKDAGLNESISFLELTFKFFSQFNIQNKEARNVRPLHFVDLMRHFLLPPSDIDHSSSRVDGVVDGLYTVSELLEGGSKVIISDSNCPLDMEYESGELKLPALTVDDSTEECLRNVIAYEQCHCPYVASITEYLRMLNLLVKTESDVNILIDKHIMVDLIGDSKVVATMIRKLNKYSVPQNSRPKYRKLCEDLISFHKNPRNQLKAKLKNKHFSSPWTTVCTILKLVIFAVGLYESGYKIHTWLMGLM